MIKPTLWLSASLILASCSANTAAPSNNAAIEFGSLSDTESERYLQTALDLFDGANTVGNPKLVECTLSEGTKTTCFSVTVKPEPTSYTPGPWCPRNVSDGPDQSGIWLDKGKVYDADCVECALDYMSAESSMTYIIPVKPIPAKTSSPARGGAGVAINGVKLDGPAPVDAILDAHTLAPFDDCSGHVNLHAGYHYHALTDCLVDKSSKPSGDADAPVIGIAMNGYQILSHKLSNGKLPVELDGCQGHSTADIGYHYHAGATGSNQILGCLTAQQGCSSEDAGQSCDASVKRGAPPGEGAEEG